MLLSYEDERWWWPFPIFEHGGSGATAFGRVVHKRKPGSFIWEAYRFFERIHDAWWWIKYRVVPKHRYHVVKTDLEPGYYDCDTVMLHACMSLLCQFIEVECGGEKEVDSWSKNLRELCEVQAARQDELLLIYRWWKYERPAEQSREHDLAMRWHKSKNEGEWSELETLMDKIENDENVMLRRLMDIRCSLWT